MFRIMPVNQLLLTGGESGFQKLLDHNAGLLLSLFECTFSQ